MKGKGHEFSDVARLLNFYQLWLDGLYPRAKFADGLQLIEKAGHSKRMQVMRKEWIDEGKPGYIKPGTELVESILNDEFPATGHAGFNGQPTRQSAALEPLADDAMFFPSPSKNAQRDMTGVIDPEDDELDALLAEQENAPRSALAPPNPGAESEGEDDLDALLAEQESYRVPQARGGETPEAGEEEDDDLDALLAEHETRSGPQKPTIVPQPPSSSRPSSSHSVAKARKSAVFDDTDSEGDDDLDALLAEQTARQRRSTPPTSPSRADAEAPSLPEQPKHVEPAENSGSQNTEAKVLSSSPMRKDALKTKIYSSSPLPNNPEEEDDLDALLAEAGM